MTGRRFLDTNVAVYAYDSSAADKQTTAQQMVDHRNWTKSMKASRHGMLKYLQKDD